ncbi:MAG TPA: hypothetical protein VMJ11_28765, partial [Paraburkholderia sp.]|uniref:hypothetical protein n=1 Tax=Paraburkholderia sp. TaxID=1926495 RepID=UPI002BB77507
STGRFGHAGRRAAKRCADTTDALYIATARGCRIASFKGLWRLFYTSIKTPKPPVTIITAVPQN